MAIAVVDVGVDVVVDVDAVGLASLLQSCVYRNAPRPLFLFMTSFQVPVPSSQPLPPPPWRTAPLRPRAAGVEALVAVGVRTKRQVPTIKRKRRAVAVAAAADGTMMSRR